MKTKGTRAEKKVKTEGSASASLSIKNIKVFSEDLDLFNILCIENDNSTQPEMFNKILEEFRHNGK